MSFEAADPRQLPQPQAPFLMPDGTINPVWYQWLVSQDKALRAVLTFLRAQYP